MGIHRSICGSMAGCTCMWLSFVRGRGCWSRNACRPAKKFHGNTYWQLWVSSVLSVTARLPAELAYSTTTSACRTQPQALLHCMQAALFTCTFMRMARCSPALQHQELTCRIWLGPRRCRLQVLHALSDQCVIRRGRGGNRSLMGVLGGSRGPCRRVDLQAAHDGLVLCGGELKGNYSIAV